MASALAGGGVGGVIIAVFYLLYKCLQGKKLVSKCCGGELQVSTDTQVQQQQQIQNIPHTNPSSSQNTTPNTTPVLTTAVAPSLSSIPEEKV